jgi:hypothetical protein
MRGVAVIIIVLRVQSWGTGRMVALSGGGRTDVSSNSLAAVNEDSISFSGPIEYHNSRIRNGKRTKWLGNEKYSPEAK